MEKKKKNKISHSESMKMAITALYNSQDVNDLPSGEGSLDFEAIVLSRFMENPTKAFTKKMIFDLAFPKNGLSERRRKEILEFLKSKKAINSKFLGEEEVYFLEEKYEYLMKKPQNK